MRGPLLADMERNGFPPESEEIEPTGVIATDHRITARADRETQLYPNASYIIYCIATSSDGQVGSAWSSARTPRIIPGPFEVVDFDIDPQRLLVSIREVGWPGPRQPDWGGGR